VQPHLQDGPHLKILALQALPERAKAAAAVQAVSEQLLAEVQV
jgi:hypothetical protein